MTGRGPGARRRAKRRPAEKSLILTRRTFPGALGSLCARDRDLARVVERFGRPPLWRGRPGFPALVRTILGQQVSLASARAAFERLTAAATPLTPRSFLGLDDAALCSFGFSRQKVIYARELARRIVAGDFPLEALEAMPDEEARAELLRLKGVGPWTADIYLLNALGRADAFPAADLTLLIAAHRVKRLPARPTPEGLTALAERWRPLRAVAAHVLWHHYLNAPRLTPA